MPVGSIFGFANTTSIFKLHSTRVYVHASTPKKIQSWDMLLTEFSSVDPVNDPQPSLWKCPLYVSSQAPIPVPPSRVLDLV